MNQRSLGLLAAVLTLVVAIMTIRAGVLTPTGHAIAAGSSGSIVIAGIMVVIAIGLFAKYFGLIK